MKTLFILAVFILTSCVTVVDEHGEKWWKIETPIQVVGLGLGSIVLVAEGLSVLDTQLVKEEPPVKGDKSAKKH